jgi:hypothetical protein
VPAFTMLSTAPSADVKPYHGRQIAVLRPETGPPGFTLPNPQPTCCGHCLQGLLDVATVRKGMTNALALSW